MARLWDLARKESLRLEGHTDTVNVLAYSRRGDRFVTGSFDGTARLYSADGSFLAVLAGHGAALTMVAWSPRDDMVATASKDGDVRLWTKQGAWLATLPHPS